MSVKAVKTASGAKLVNRLAWMLGDASARIMSIRVPTTLA